MGLTHLIILHHKHIHKTVTNNGCLFGTSELKSSLAQLQFAVFLPVRPHVVHHGFSTVIMAFLTSSPRLSATIEYESTRIRSTSDGLCALRSTSSGLPAASASTERSSAWAYV